MSVEEGNSGHKNWSLVVEKTCRQAEEEERLRRNKELSMSRRVSGCKRMCFLPSRGFFVPDLLLLHLVFLMNRGGC